MNNVKRWIYNVLPILTKFYSCPRYMHNHIPKHSMRVDVFGKMAGKDCFNLAYEVPDQPLPAGARIQEYHAFGFEERIKEEVSLINQSDD